MKTYEAMFLFDPTFAGDFAKVEGEIRRILDRADAETLCLGKWDERRLAYEIKGRKRGCYVLVFFKAPSEKITGLERDAQISEQVLRLLVVRTEGYTQEYMENLVAQGAGRAGGNGARKGGGRSREDRPPPKPTESAKGADRKDEHGDKSVSGAPVTPAVPVASAEASESDAP